MFLLPPGRPGCRLPSLNRLKAIFWHLVCKSSIFLRSELVENFAGLLWNLAFSLILKITPGLHRPSQAICVAQHPCLSGLTFLTMEIGLCAPGGLPPHRKSTVTWASFTFNTHLSYKRAGAACCFCPGWEAGLVRSTGAIPASDPVMSASRSPISSNCKWE